MKCIFAIFLTCDEKKNFKLYRGQDAEEVGRNWVVLKPRDDQVDVQLQHVEDALLDLGRPPLRRVRRQKFSERFSIFDENFGKLLTNFWQTFGKLLANFWGNFDNLKSKFSMKLLGHF
jgi:hypothetical protein